MQTLKSYLGIIGMALLAASWIWYSISNIWGVVNWVLLVPGVAALGWFLFDYFSSRRKNVSAHALKKGSNTAVQVVVALAIIAMLAFVTSRRHYRVDLTENQLYSLSDQTLKVLENLEKDVQVKAFFKTDMHEFVQDRLDEYGYRSAKFSYEVIDPDEQVGVAKQYGISKYNTLAVESGPKRELIENLEEKDLTNAIIKVTREQDKVVYFVTGHGEKNIEDDTPQGYKNAAEAIRKENHTVKKLNLIRRGGVPDSAHVVIVASPQVDYAPAELDSLESFVNRGGKLMLLLDPDGPAGMRAFASRFGADVGADVVIDGSGFGQLFGAGPGMPMVQNYADHEITKNFELMTFFPLASSVRKQDGDRNITELLKTSQQSWAEKDYASGEVSYDENEDRIGPITLAVIAEKDGDSGKSVVAVFGDSDFAINGYFGQQGNGDLFLNTINYLAEEEDLISIRPKRPDDRRLTLTQADVSMIFYLVVIAAPLLMVVAGVVVFIKRNKS